MERSGRDTLLTETRSPRSHLRFLICVFGNMLPIAPTLLGALANRCNSATFQM